MREIKFRGRKVDNGLWVYGYFMKTPITTEFNCNGQFLDSGENGRYCIVQDNVAHEISIKTLGEFTGLKDVNGKDIYEGDILYINSLGKNGKVIFQSCCFILEYENGENDLFDSKDEVIGNIYENPELLEFSE